MNTLRTRGQKEQYLLAQLALIAPVSLLGGVAGVLLTWNGDFSFDNIVLAQRRAAVALSR